MALHTEATMCGRLPRPPPPPQHGHIAGLQPPPPHTFSPMMHGFEAQHVRAMALRHLPPLMFASAGPHFVHTSVPHQPVPPPPPPPLISTAPLARMPPSPREPQPYTGEIHRPRPVTFTQQDVDRVLYGYAKSRGGQSPGHALSGLRTTQLSYGIDRILGRRCHNQSQVKSPLSAHIDPSALHVPEGLQICENHFTGSVHHGVFCTKDLITKGTRFGPFQGRKVNTSEIKTFDDNSHMWEIFQDGKLSHFVDGRGSAGNWMAFVNCARHALEQNLTVVQENDEIFYETCKDIPRGSELLVWYGDSYNQFMGIPVSLKEVNDGTLQVEAESSEGYKCERCGKMFAYKYYRDKHLKYTRCVDQGDRKFPCHLCNRSFEKRDRLRIHILHVHERHRPHKCSVCDKSFSQSSSLNKHMRVHSGERPYKCVYCSKAFTASSILRTHIRQHSGEKPFKCAHCGKAFASHAAHDSHVRRTHTKERPCICDVCGKAFAQAYELKFHMNMHTEKTPSPRDIEGISPLIPRDMRHFPCDNKPAPHHDVSGDFIQNESHGNKFDTNMNIRSYARPIDVAEKEPVVMSFPVNSLVRVEA